MHNALQTRGGRWQLTRALQTFLRESWIDVFLTAFGRVPQGEWKNNAQRNLAPKIRDAINILPDDDQRRKYELGVQEHYEDGTEDCDPPCAVHDQQDLYDEDGEETRP